MDFPSLGVSRNHQTSDCVSPAEQQHDVAAAASDMSSLNTIDSATTSNTTSTLTAANSVSASTMGKNFKTEYKSNFRPFDQYVYNSITDSFVHQHTGDISAVNTITTSDQNPTISTSPSPLEQVSTSTGRNAHDSVLFKPTDGRQSNQTGDPWYKEVQRRNERANEYRFKSEVGHNSPLMMMHQEQASKSVSPAVSSQYLFDDAQSIASGDVQQQATPDSTTDALNRQPVYRFTPGDYYKRDHMIANMANNNNFNLPKDSVHNQRPATSMAISQTTNRISLANRSGAGNSSSKLVSAAAPNSHRSQTRSATQTRARSQSSRRQPASSGASGQAKAANPPTKSAHTTPTRSRPAGLSNGTPARLTTKTQVAARTPTSVVSRKPAVSTTTTRTVPVSVSSSQTKSCALTGTKRVPSSSSSRLAPTSTARAAATPTKTAPRASTKPNTSKPSTRTTNGNAKVPAVPSPISNVNSSSRLTSRKPPSSSSKAADLPKTAEVRKISSGRPSLAATQSAMLETNHQDSEPQPEAVTLVDLEKKSEPEVTVDSTVASSEAELDENASGNAYVRQCQQDFDLGEPYSMMPISSSAGKTSKEGSISSLSHELNGEQLDEQLKRIEVLEQDKPTSTSGDVDEDSSEDSMGDEQAIADTSAALTSANTTLDETTLLPEKDLNTQAQSASDDKLKQETQLLSTDNLIESVKEIGPDHDPPTLSNTISVEPRIHESSYGQPSNLDSGSEEDDTSADEPDLVTSVAGQVNASQLADVKTPEAKQSELLMNIVDLIDTGSDDNHQEQSATTGTSAETNQMKEQEGHELEKKTDDLINELVLLPGTLVDDLAAPLVELENTTHETNLEGLDETILADGNKTEFDEFPLLDISEFKPIEDPLLAAFEPECNSSGDEVMDDELRVIGRKIVPKLRTDDMANDDNDDDDNVDEDAMLDISKDDHHYRWEHETKSKPKASDDSDNDMDNDEQLKLTNSDDEFILKPRDGAIGSQLEPDMTGSQSEVSEVGNSATSAEGKVEHQDETTSESTLVAVDSESEANKHKPDEQEKQQQQPAVEI